MIKLFETKIEMCFWLTHLQARVVVIILMRLRLYTLHTHSRTLTTSKTKATLYIFGRVPLSFIVHFYLVKMKVPDSIGLCFLIYCLPWLVTILTLTPQVPLELTWKLIFHVPIYLYMFWVAYQKVRKGIRAARENIKRKPNVVMRNPNWQWLLGKPVCEMTLTWKWHDKHKTLRHPLLPGAVLFNYTVDGDDNVYANGPIVPVEPVRLHPRTESSHAESALDQLFTRHWLCRAHLLHRLHAQRTRALCLSHYQQKGKTYTRLLLFRRTSLKLNHQIGLVPELSDDFSFKIKKRRKQMYSWNSDDGLSSNTGVNANVNASANVDSGKVQLHSVQEKETGRVVPKGTNRAKKWQYQCQASNTSKIYFILLC